MILPRSAHKVKRLSVLVPAESSHWSKYIRRGSALIEIPSNFKNGKKLVYFEGNMTGDRDLVRYANKCYYAACRGLASYPTVASAVIAPADLIEVGYYDMQEEAVTVTDPVPLLAWCGWEKVDPQELVATF
jgi:hypothetical protein